MCVCCANERTIKIYVGSQARRGEVICFDIIQRWDATTSLSSDIMLTHLLFLIWRLKVKIKFNIIAVLCERWKPAQVWRELRKKQKQKHFGAISGPETQKTEIQRVSLLFRKQNFQFGGHCVLVLSFCVIVFRRKSRSFSSNYFLCATVSLVCQCEARWLSSTRRNKDTTKTSELISSLYAQMSQIWD